MPRTGYVFCNGEDAVPMPNAGKFLDDPKSIARSSRPWTATG